MTALVLFVVLISVLSCGIAIGALLFRTSRGSDIRAQLETIINQGRTTLADINDLKTAVSTLVADTSKALADIAAKLAALAANQADPAVAAGINDAVADLSTLDASIKAADPGPTA